MQNPFLHASLSALIRDARCICKCTKKSINHFFAAHSRPPPASPPRVSTNDAVFRPTLGRIIFLFYIFASRLCMHSAFSLHPGISRCSGRFAAQSEPRFAEANRIHSRSFLCDCSCEFFAFIRASMSAADSSNPQRDSSRCLLCT